MVSARVEHHLALLQRNHAQILEGALHERLAIRWQGGPAASGKIRLHAVLGRHVLQSLGTGKAALPLLLRHLVHLVQLLHQPLLVGERKPVEIRVVTQHPLLVLDRQAPVLIEPVAQVTRRRRAGIGVTRPSGDRIG